MIVARVALAVMLVWVLLGLTTMCAYNWAKWDVQRRHRR